MFLSRSMNKQLALSIQLNDEAILDDFCWQNNPLVEQEIMKTLKGYGERFIMLWGVEGAGKSHLLQGCCQTMHHAGKALYLPLQILQEWGPESLEGLEHQNLIALDDVHLIAGDAAWEEALFHLYNKIYANGHILIMSTALPITQIKIRLPDLKSRLSWGLTMQLQELSDELKITVLKQYASKRGFDLPSSVGQFLINRCARNMHDLQHILNQLDEASLAAQRKITIPFVKTILNI